MGRDVVYPVKTFKSLLDIHHPDPWHAPVAAATVFSTHDDGRKRLWNSVVDRPWTSLLDIHHPDPWHAPVAAATVFSTPYDGRKRLWNSVVDRPWTSLLDIHHPDPWHSPVAATTVFSTPDDGRRKCPKKCRVYLQLLIKQYCPKLHLVGSLCIIDLWCTKTQIKKTSGS